MKNKILKIFFILLLPSILLSEDISDNHISIPKNIKESDMLSLNIKPLNFMDYLDGNCIIDNKSYNIEKFWMAYFNSKENKIQNFEYYQGDEFYFNDEKRLFNTIKNKKYILYNIKINELPEYNFKNNSFIFSDDFLFPSSDMGKGRYTDCSGKETWITYFNTIQPVKINISPDKAKFLKLQNITCNLQIFIQIIKPTYRTFNSKRSCTKRDGEYPDCKCVPDKYIYKQIQVKPLKYALIYKDENGKSQVISN